MEKKSIKIRAKLKNDVTTIKAIVPHPMETGARKNKETGELIPAHFIQEITCESNGKTLLSAEWSGGVSKNPYLSFKFKGGKKGDTVTLKWADNQGKSESAEAKIVG